MVRLSCTSFMYSCCLALVCAFSCKMLNKHVVRIFPFTLPFDKYRIVCVIFVLLEVAVMIILFYLIILPIYQDGLFDRVLKLRGLRHVLKQNEGNDVVKCLRGVHGGLLIVFFQASLSISPTLVLLMQLLHQSTHSSKCWALVDPLTSTPAPSPNPPADMATVPSQCIPYLRAKKENKKPRHFVGWRGEVLCALR